MKKYIPKLYKKDVCNVNYKLLESLGIKCLIFDLDNTLMGIDDEYPSDKVCDLIKILKKKFEIWILSNNSDRKRLDKVANVLKIDYISNYNPNEVCIIGDQIMTDILGGNKLGIYTVLLEPIGVKDLKITSINRILEKRNIAKMEKLGVFKKGEFYE